MDHVPVFTMSPDQKGIETDCPRRVEVDWFTMSPDQKGIETSLG